MARPVLLNNEFDQNEFDQGLPKNKVYRSAGHRAPGRQTFQFVS